MQQVIAEVGVNLPCYVGLFIHIIIAFPRKSRVILVPRYSCNKQEELQEVQSFKQTVAGYRPQLLSLDAASAECCTPPPTPGGRPQPTKPDETASEVAKELQGVWDRYNSLEVAATERETVLAEFLPIVQQHESSQGAWLQILENWEETVANLSPPATTPAHVEQQIKEIKVSFQYLYS